MRFLIAAAATTLLAASAAHAADLDLGPLRGTGQSYGYGYGADLGPVADWSGVYVGGFGGYGQSDFQNKNGVENLIYSVTRDSTLEQQFQVSRLLHLKSKDVRDTAFGGFVGYNYQIDEVVLGIEADYTATQLRGTSTDSIARRMSTSDGDTHQISLSGSAMAEIKSYGTARVRAGYTLGPLMPFVTGGVAIADIDTKNAATINWTQYTAGIQSAYICRGSLGCPFPELTKTKSTVAVGFTAGAGLDYMLTENIFLRGEYQYAFFNDFDGHKFNLNVVRGGAGVKF
jgi:opacity protein-like surface antigen